MAQYVFDLRRVTVSISNAVIRGGAGENDYIKITPNEPRFKDKIGQDGSWTSVKNHNRTARFELTLLSGAEGNQILSSLIKNDYYRPNGAGIGPFLVKDLENGIVISGTCRLTDEPEIAFNNSVPEMVWKGTIDQLVISFNGPPA